MDLALNKLQWLICHKTKPNQGLQTIKEFIEKELRPNYSRNSSKNKSFYNFKTFEANQESKETQHKFSENKKWIQLNLKAICIIISLQ